LEKPVVAQFKPYAVVVEEGKNYLWCSCGLSKTQPFCDKSHAGTEFKPLRYTATANTTALFCGCKHTSLQPLCDGSHNNLTDEYAADERPLAQLRQNSEYVEFDKNGRAMLDGNCYVQRPSALQWKQLGNISVAPIITVEDGAEHLSQYAGRLLQSGSTALASPGADVVIYVHAGGGNINVSGMLYKLAPRMGVHIRPGETFELSADDNGQPMEFLICICPGGKGLKTVDQVTYNFQSEYPNRTVAFDPSQQESMADRFYQVLVGETIGSDEVAQFIGQIPKSKAAPHRHLYEETLMILSAHGTMWTENRRTDVKAGDFIFLPAQQEHSLQCCDDAGMELVGHFYPSGTPNINY
jgi:CDGSH-type Zn-finger protein/quercetin dioxygenase-like cupin family protein